MRRVRGFSGLRQAVNLSSDHIPVAKRFELGGFMQQEPGSDEDEPGSVC
jgi:hypothetical protein